MSNKGNNSPNPEEFFAFVSSCRRYIGVKKVVRECLIFLGALVIGFFFPLAWLVYLIYVLRKPIIKLISWTSESDLDYVPTSKLNITNEPEPTPQKEFYFTDGSGNFAKSGCAFRDWSGQIVQWGSPFRDKRGNLIQWGSAFYDNRDNLVQWGSPFYDPSDNLVFPQ